MGIWKEVGKALNSTVKTGKCIPLNEMIDALKTTLVNREVPVSLQRISASSSTTTMITAANISGKGYSDISIHGEGDIGEYSLVSVTVDGNALYNNAKLIEICDEESTSGGYSYHVKVRFNKSIVIEICGRNVSAKTSANGVVYFEN